METPVTNAEPLPEVNGPAATPPPVRPTLADRLAHILADRAPDAPLTLKAVFEQTEGHGIYLILLLFCLPFVTPVSIPGFSNVLGLALLFIGVRIALGLPPMLPRRYGDRVLPAGFRKVLATSIKVLRFLERWVRPRRTTWLRWRTARFVNGFLIALMAALLALPLPPIIPLTNTLPAYAILFLALSMMEEDGVLIWFGYVAVVANIAYFIFWADVITAFLIKYQEPVQNWLRHWL